MYRTERERKLRMRSAWVGLDHMNDGLYVRMGKGRGGLIDLYYNRSRARGSVASSLCCRNRVLFGRIGTEFTFTSGTGSTKGSCENKAVISPVNESAKCTFIESLTHTRGVI